MHVLFEMRADGGLSAVAANAAYRVVGRSMFGDTWTEPVGLDRIEFLQRTHIPQPLIDQDNVRYERALREKQVVTYESELMLERPLIFEARIEPIQDSAGTTTHVLWTARDVTERRLAARERETQAAELRASLEEKSTLLSEVHHRVKNNLQVIDSLLHFQMQRLTSEEALTSFEDARARLRTMTLVHDQLYDAENLTRINLVSYTRSLLSRLGATFDATERLQLNADEGDLFLPVDAALPCGMILNELVVNALKYAYPTGSEGAVRVSLTSDDGMLSVSVADDGIGATAGTDAGKGFGLRLVDRLVAQIGGSVHRQADHTGTRVTVKVPRQ